MVTDQFINQINLRGVVVACAFLKVDFDLLWIRNSADPIDNRLDVRELVFEQTEGTKVVNEHATMELCLRISSKSFTEIFKYRLRILNGQVVVTSFENGLEYEKSSVALFEWLRQ